jgi:predicted secreted acid phosphatase
VVLDIDDTSLSSFISLKKDNFSILHIDDNNARADAPAVKPTLRLYNTAVRSGVSVFFISMRSENIRSNTITNLQGVGYYGWAGLYLPKPGEGSRTYKTTIRKMLISQGYDIVLNIGDQYTDIDGGYAEKAYKLPNLMYDTSKAPCNDKNICT